MKAVPEEFDFSDGNEIRCVEVPFSAAARECRSRLSVNDWLTKKRIELGYETAAIFERVLIADYDLSESVLIRVVSEKGGRGVLKFERSCFSGALESLSGEVSAATIGELCHGLAKHTSIGRNPSCATEDEFLASVPRLSKGQMEIWHHWLDCEFHTTELSSAYQLTVNLARHKVKGDPLYAWSVMEAAWVQAMAASR